MRIEEETNSETVRHAAQRMTEQVLDSVLVYQDNLVQQKRVLARLAKEAQEVAIDRLVSKLSIRQNNLQDIENHLDRVRLDLSRQHHSLQNAMDYSIYHSSVQMRCSSTQTEQDKEQLELVRELCFTKVALEGLSRQYPEQEAPLGDLQMEHRAELSKLKQSLDRREEFLSTQETVLRSRSEAFEDERQAWKDTTKRKMDDLEEARIVVRDLSKVVVEREQGLRASEKENRKEKRKLRKLRQNLEEKLEEVESGLKEKVSTSAHTDEIRQLFVQETERKSMCLEEIQMRHYLQEVERHALRERTARKVEKSLKWLKKKRASPSWR